MPYPESLLCRLCDSLEAATDEMQAGLTDAHTPGVIDQAEARRLLTHLLPAVTLAVTCEGAQRAGYHVARTGRLPRDYELEQNAA